jgi:phosphoglycerol transferase MdoB-like AlkP superfamily enzyme
MKGKLDSDENKLASITLPIANIVCTIGVLNLIRIGLYSPLPILSFFFIILYLISVVGLWMYRKWAIYVFGILTILILFQAFYFRSALSLKLVPTYFNMIVGFFGLFQITGWVFVACLWVYCTMFFKHFK